MKALRKLLSLLIVLALFGGGITYALTPDNNIKNSEKLANVQASTTLEDLNGDFLSNISYANSKVSTSLKIDNDTFLSIFKNAVEKDSELLNGSYKLVGNHIEAKLPVKLGLWDTMINTNVKVVGANNSVDLILEDAKIGKVPIPDFALEKYLKEAAKSGNRNAVFILADIYLKYDKLNLAEKNIWVSYERNMHCGIGKCGHCKMDATYICLDGPVFDYEFAKNLVD